MSSEMISAITMPKWGLSMHEGQFLMWLINEGETFTKNQEIAEVEIEKVVSSIEASLSGKLRKIVTEDEAVYPVGALLGVVADTQVPEQAITAFIEQFQSEFILEDENEQDEYPVSKRITVNNTEINYKSIGDGAETIILIHGFGGDMDDWFHNQDVLMSNTGKRVIVLDLPGHGQSSKALTDGSLDFFADTLYQFLHLLNTKQAHLVGHSLGGGIALSIAERYPECVISVSLICPVGLGKEINVDYLDKFISSMNKKQVKESLEQMFFDTGGLTRQRINSTHRYKRVGGVNSDLQEIMNDLINGNDQKQQFNHICKKLSERLCIIWGERDRIIPASHINNIDEYASTHLIPNAGHMVQVESAKKVNDLLSEFINKFN